jgi:hypothetical protein
MSAREIQRVLRTLHRESQECNREPFRTEAPGFKRWPTNASEELRTTYQMNGTSLYRTFFV